MPVSQKFEKNPFNKIKIKKSFSIRTPISAKEKI